MQTELIIVSEYCHKCHIEPSFIELLEEGGLINVHTEGSEHYLLVSELPDVERYSRMYHHLLERIEEIKREMDSLRKQLTLYRKREIEDTDW